MAENGLFGHWQEIKEARTRQALRRPPPQPQPLPAPAASIARAHQLLAQLEALPLPQAAAQPTSGAPASPPVSAAAMALLALQTSLALRAPPLPAPAPALLLQPGLSSSSGRQAGMQQQQPQLMQALAPAAGLSEQPHAVPQGCGLTGMMSARLQLPTLPGMAAPAHMQVPPASAAPQPCPRTPPGRQPAE
jgi:hypothetical protein